MLAPWKKSYDQPRQHIKKQRHYFANKGPSSQSYGFSKTICFFTTIMYGCERWTIKKAEHRRIDAFDPWCWRRLLRVPWTTRRSGQSILNQSWILIGRSDAETPILRPPDVKSQLIGKDSDAGKDERQRMTWWDSISRSMDVNLSKLWERVEDRGARHGAAHGGNKELATT